MFGSNVIDILIGLIVIFLFVGLAISAGTEIISHWISLRSRGLKKALLGMIDGTAAQGTKIPDDHWFFSQALLRSMYVAREKFPSYMDSKTFSEALLLAIDNDFASKKGQELVESLEKSLKALPLDEGLKQLIRSYIHQAEGNAGKLRALVEGWFDRVMDRTSGWYKRNVSIINLIIAVIIVGAANIDTLAIARALHGSDTLRAKMLEVADRVVATAPAPAPVASQPGAAALPPAAAAENPTPSTNTDIEESHVQLKALKDEFKSMQQSGLPLGWEGDMPTGVGWLTKVVGWLITICAATLGAPFWFDMLSKITNIRSAGPKPVTKTDVVSPPVVPGEH